MGSRSINSGGKPSVWAGLALLVSGASAIAMPDGHTVRLCSPPPINVSLYSEILKKISREKFQVWDGIRGMRITATLTKANSSQPPN